MCKSLEANKHTDPSRTLNLKRMTNVLLMHHTIKRLPYRHLELSGSSKVLVRANFFVWRHSLHNTALMILHMNTTTTLMILHIYSCQYQRLICEHPFSVLKWGSIIRKKNQISKPQVDIKSGCSHINCRYYESKSTTHFTNLFLWTGKFRWRIPLLF